MSVQETALRIVWSPRTALGSAIVLDLSVRTADLRPVLGSTSDLLVPLISVSVGTFGAKELGTVTTWLLIATAFYHITPANIS